MMGEASPIASTWTTWAIRGDAGVVASDHVADLLGAGLP